MSKHKKNNARSSFDTLMDLYWGGTERRITGLTLRIIGINFLSLSILMIATLNFGQYETKIITSRLQDFATQTSATSRTLSYMSVAANDLNHVLSAIHDTTGDAVFILQNGKIIAQTHTTSEILPALTTAKPASNILTLNDIIHWLISVMPNRDRLPNFPRQSNGDAHIQAAQKAAPSIMAWRPQKDDIIFSAIHKITYQGQEASVFTLRSGQIILSDLRYFWQQFFNLFFIMLGFTILVSIYLSGTIARPLRKLSRTAEYIRRQKDRHVEIPDFSQRHDEIGELSLVMRDMTESLWKRVDTIEQFAADVAHELKNPLTSLKSAAETLKISKKQDQREKLIGIIEHDIQRMDRLITDISQASRLDAELSREELNIVNLHTCLKSITDRYKQHYGDRYIFKAILPDEHRFLCKASEVRLVQVFDNILDNALSFSPDQGQILISLYQGKYDNIITIEDEGPGIPDSKLQAIFDRFYSQRRKNDQFGEHSGLGLAICKQIIESIGGTISAHNKPQKHGAIFTITIPTTSGSRLDTIVTSAP